MYCWGGGGLPCLFLCGGCEYALLREQQKVSTAQIRNRTFHMRPDAGSIMVWSKDKPIRSSVAYVLLLLFRLYLKDSPKVNGYLSGEFPGRVDETKGK